MTITTDPLSAFDDFISKTEALSGVRVPDPITFVVGERWLNRPNIYPRQATLLKVIFLRDDLFTDYDREVIAEWEDAYAKTGNNGICPNIMWRIKWLKAQGFPYFREILLVLGRRAGKGYVSALTMAYVLWRYMSKGDPQGFYGVDRDKKLTLMCFAAKRDQAKENVWTDIVNVILGSTCFAKYVGRPLGESLSVMAPNDVLRAAALRARGIDTAMDISSFSIVPKESTLTAGRGPASFAQCLDPSTPVLTADLRWVPIGSLAQGDEIVGVDEAPLVAGSHRKMRRAVVQKVWRTRKSALRLTFDDGSSVVCSPDHQWLFKGYGRGGGYLWRFTHQMRVGARIRHVVDPWESDWSFDGGWLAGLYDGEGSVIGRTGGGKYLSLSQNQGPVLDRALSILLEKGYDPTIGSMKDRVCQQWNLDTPDSMRLLGSLRPVRLLPKAHDVWEGAALRKGKTPHGRIRRDAYKTIVAIEEMPEQDLVDITTSTRTFLANGLVSHNCYDEMAHVVNSGANRSAEDVYAAATPSLDQFGKDAIIVEPSSPWQMMGQFYENYQHSIELEDGKPVYPEMLMLQLASWDIYLDWERAHEIPLFPEGFAGDLGEYEGDNADPLPGFQRLRGAIQAYDDQMERLERSNPETFKVERRSHFAAALDAYLNPGKVAQIFEDWLDRPERYGPARLLPQDGGILAMSYKGHGDPSKVNDKFGLALAHAEYDDQGRAHCVFDILHHFDPADYPGGIIDYESVDEWIWKNVITKFYPDEFTFDQYNSTSSIQRLQKKVRNTTLPKRIEIYEKTTTGPYDWTVKENTKAAINLGLVHAPATSFGDSYERAELELRFLQKGTGNKVDHPSSGPVQSKDIADAMAECIHVLIGEQVNNFVHGDLAGAPTPSLQGGIGPFANAMDRAEEERIRAMSGFARSRGVRDDASASRRLRGRGLRYGR